MTRKSVSAFEGGCGFFSAAENIANSKEKSTISSFYLFYYSCACGNQVRPVLPVFEFRETSKSSFQIKRFSLMFPDDRFRGMTAERFC
ncbi:TPA: hypothetical protein ACKUH8_000405, partial [Neisseria gonorrhoeae]